VECRQDARTTFGRGYNVSAHAVTNLGKEIRIQPQVSLNLIHDLLKEKMQLAESPQRGLSNVDARNSPTPKAVFVIGRKEMSKFFQRRLVLRRKSARVAESHPLRAVRLCVSRGHDNWAEWLTVDLALIFEYKFVESFHNS
jgi:hypothetical protein